MVCDEEVARLVKAVVAGDVLALAPLLDRLHELGVERARHLHSSLGWLFEKFKRANRINEINSWHEKVSKWEEQKEWIERAFWPEIHGGAVPALQWLVEELKR